ncbi:hypothetical protein EHP00_624 [Ecytonucleospora hepatopenaei]|uniref:Major facilitator superfamily associated domain-containing protein n=1 Tax=Ecytonucleospora hepatopenaei TaxID=646526 RepID=A0A1W0E2K4_9MICR|nr:hypothetical protein EHP00_624 [Ecytonucleospora hepatopenaei]
MNALEKWENKFLFVPKILQLVICLQYYTLHNLRHLFAIDKFNIPIKQYGEFNAYIQCVTFFSNIAIGSFADRTGKHKKILIGLIMMTCGILSIFYISNILPFNAVMFWIVLYVYQTFNLPKQPLLDKIIYSYLEEKPDCSVKDYGKQRAWGTVAYMAATFLVEMMVKSHVKNKTVYNWNNLFLYCAIFTALSVGSLVFLVHTKESVKNTQKTTGYVQLLKNKEYSFFIFIMFLNAITRQAMSNYLGCFQARILQIKPYNLPSSWPKWWSSIVNIFNKNYISTFTVFGTFFEIMSMFFSGGIIRRFGYFLPLLFAQIISLVRFYAYYTLDKKGKHVFLWSCLIELIKGIYFGLAYISAFQIAARLAPSYLSATSQMIFQGVFNALGSLVSGKAFSLIFGDTLKGKSDKAASKSEIKAFENLFLVNIIIMSITILIFVIKYGVIDGVLTSREKEERKLTYVETEEDIAAREEMERQQAEAVPAV